MRSFYFNQVSQKWKNNFFVGTTFLEKTALKGRI